MISILLITSVLAGCKPQKKDIKSQPNTMDSTQVYRQSEAAQKVASYLKKDMIIAHRGSTYFTPEETEPAFRWARNIGADYLELDVQLTKDSVLIAFHDTNLSRTTNVASVFPERAKSEIAAFTLKELRSLDAGSKFNEQHKDRARAAFKGLTILTLKDVIMIAEGYRIKRNNGKPVKEVSNGIWTGHYLYEKDPVDNGNRPGIYVETKNPKPGVEKVLYDVITEMGWNTANHPKTIATQKDKVAVADSKARLVLQSFSTNSLLELEKLLPNVPKCLLLWKPDMKGDIHKAYRKAIDFSLQNNIEIIGPSIAGAPNNYEELTADWMAEIIHKAGLQIHAYTFDTKQQFAEYHKSVEGVFTNRSDLALDFYNRKNHKDPVQILNDLGY